MPARASPRHQVAHAHLRYLNPFPANLGEVLRRYPKVVAPELNLGQLAQVLRGKYLVDVQSVTKVKVSRSWPTRLGALSGPHLPGDWPSLSKTRRWSPDCRRPRREREQTDDPLRR